MIFLQLTNLIFAVLQWFFCWGLSKVEMRWWKLLVTDSIRLCGRSVQLVLLDDLLLCLLIISVWLCGADPSVSPLDILTSRVFLACHCYYLIANLLQCTCYYPIKMLTSLYVRIVMNLNLISLYYWKYLDFEILRFVCGSIS